MWHWLDFVVVVFAGSAIVDAWKNGSIFADWRAFFENDEPAVAGEPDPGTFTREEMVDNLTSWATQGNTQLPWLMRLADRFLPRWVGELLSCSFCLSHHTPWLVSVVLIFPATLVHTEWLAFLLRLPAYSLAATRIANLINELAPEKARYERFK